MKKCAQNRCHSNLIYFLGIDEMYVKMTLNGQNWAVKDKFSLVSIAGLKVLVHKLTSTQQQLNSQIMIKKIMNFRRRRRYGILKNIYRARIELDRYGSKFFYLSCAHWMISIHSEQRIGMFFFLLFSNLMKNNIREDFC